jgi:hypothetical protein
VYITSSNEPAPWPLKNQNSRNTGYCPNSGISDPNNSTLFASQFSMSFSKPGNCSGIVVGNNGVIYCNQREGVEPLLLAYSSKGDELWHISTPENATEYLTGLVLTPNERLIAIRTDYNSHELIQIEAYNSETGEFLWKIKPDFPNSNRAYSTSSYGWIGTNVIYSHIFENPTVFCTFFAVNEENGSIVWQTRNYTDCKGVGYNPVIDNRMNSTDNDNSTVAILYASLTSNRLTIIDCVQGKEFTELTISESISENTTSVIGNDGSLYFISQSRSLQILKTSVCKLPGYPAINNGTVLWCVEIDSLNESDTYWTVVLRFDEAHNRVVVSFGKCIASVSCQHKIRSLDPNSGNITWSKFTPIVHFGADLESLVLDEKGNYYLVHDGHLTIVQWEYGDIINNITLADFDVSFLAIGAGRLYATSNNITIWQTTPQDNKPPGTTPWYETLDAIIGFSVGGAILLIIAISLAFYCCASKRNYEPIKR